MSNNVDTQVVEMKFDNRQFEKGVKQSISTLDKLKASLNFGESVKGFDKLGKAAAKVDMNPLAKAVESVNVKFSALEVVGVTALANITNKVIDSATRMAKALTIDQVSSGFNKYQEKIQSVQTLVNSTGKSVDEINEYLGELMEFSDETSYSFTNMTAALAQMTSTGGKIENLVPMLKGIANATAYAGKGANEFSRAVFNLGQSYGAGYLQLMDWKSVMNAGVNSKQLAEAFIEAGKAAGTLNNECVDLKGNLVTVGNFTETLKDKWATTEVMEMAFSKFASVTETASVLVGNNIVGTYSEAYEKLEGEYADITSKAIKLSAEGAYTTAEEAFAAIYQENESVAEAVNGLIQNGVVDNAKSAFSILSSGLDDVAMKAAKSAQEAKTFQEAIDATKDAVSSQFMRIFDAIFGNYSEAKRLWTDLANGLYYKFAEPLGKIADMFEEWKEVGRSDLFEGIYNLADSLEQLLSPLKKAWAAIFPKKTVNDLINFTRRFKEFTKNIGFSVDTAKKLQETFEGVFSVFGIFLDILHDVWDTLQPIIEGINIVAGALLNITARFGGFLKNLREAVKENKALSDAFKAIGELGKQVLKLIAILIIGFGNLVSKLAEIGVIEKIFKGIYVTLSLIVALVIGSITLVVNGITKLVMDISELIGFLRGDNDLSENNIFYIILAIVLKIKNSIVGVIDGVAKFWKTLAPGESILEHIITFLKNTDLWRAFLNVVEYVKNGFARLIDVLKDWASVINPAQVAAFAMVIVLIALTSALSRLMDTMATATKTLNNFMQAIMLKFNLSAKAKRLVKETAESIALIAASLFALSLLPLNKLLPAAGILAVFAGGFAAFVIIMEKAAAKMDVKKIANFESIGRMALRLATSVMLIAGAVALIKHFGLLENLKELWDVFVIIGLMSLEVVAAAFILSKIPKVDHGTAALLAFSLSVVALVKGLQILTKGGDVNVTWEAIEMMGAMIAGMAVLVAASSKSGIGSAASLLALAVVMKTIVPTLTDLGLMIINFITELGENLPSQAEQDKVLGTVLVLSAALGGMAFALGVGVAKLGKALAMLALGAASIAVGATLAVFAIGKLYKMIHDVLSKDATDEAKISLIAAVGAFAIVATFLTFLARIVALSAKDMTIKNALAIGIFLTAFSGTLYMVALICLVLKSIDWQTAVISVGVLGVFMYGLTKVFDSMGKTKHFATGTMVSLLAALVAMFGIIVSITVMLNKGMLNQIMIGVGVMGAVILGIMALIRSISDITERYKPESLKAGALLVGSLAAVILAIAGSVSLLALFSFDQLIMPLASISLLLLELVVIIDHIANSKIKGKEFKSTAEGILIASLSMVAIAGSLVILATIPVENLLPKVIALGVLFAELAITLGILASKIQNPKAVITAAFGLAIASTSFLAISGALHIIGNIPVEGLLPKVISLGALFAALAVAVGILSNLNPSSIAVVALSLVVASASFVIIAGAMSMLANVDWDAIWKGIAAFGIIAAILAAMAALSAIPVFGQAFLIGLVGISAAMIGMSVAALILSAAAVVFAYALNLSAKAIGNLNPVLETLFAIAASSDAKDFMAFMESRAFQNFAWTVAGLGGALIVLGVGLTVASVAALAFSLALSTIVDTFNSLLSNDDVANSGTKIADGWGNAVTGTLNGSVKQLIASAASNIWQGFVDGLRNKDKHPLIGTVIGWGDAIKGGIEKFFDIHSPSRVMFAEGEYVVEGFENGMKERTTEMRRISTELSKEAKGGLMSEFLSDDGLGGKAVNWFDENTKGTILAGLSDKLKGIKDTVKVMADQGFSFDVIKDTIKNKVTDFAKFMNVTDDQLSGIIDGSAAGNFLGLDDLFDKFKVEIPDTTANLNNYSTGAGKAGTATQKLSDKLKNAIDIFSEFTQQTKVSSKDLLYNVQSQYNGVAEWVDNMKRLMYRGLDKDIFNDLLNKGTSGAGIVAGLVEMSDKEFKKYQKTAKATMKLVGDENTKVLEDYAKTGKKAVNKTEESALKIDKALLKIQERTKSFTASLKEMFGSFTDEMDLSINTTAKSFIETMTTNVEALSNFEANLKNLKSRKASDELIKYLISNKAYGLTKSLVMGSNKQIKEANKKLQEISDIEMDKTAKHVAEYEPKKNKVYQSKDYKNSLKKKYTVPIKDLIKETEGAEDFLESFKAQYGETISALKDISPEKAAQKALYNLSYSLWIATDAAQELKQQLKDGLIDHDEYVAKKLEGMARAYEDFTNTIRDNIKSQMDLFRNFEKSSKRSYDVTVNILDQIEEQTNETDDGIDKLSAHTTRTDTSKQNKVGESTGKKKLTSKDVIASMDKTVKEAEEWARNITILAASGLEQGLLKELVELGPAGYEKVNAFIEMTDDELKHAGETWKKSMNITLSDFANGIIYPDMDTTNMLNGMNEELSNIKKWSENMSKLATSGLDSGLLKYLQELGPAGADKVETFVKMTGDEIAQANAYWSESMVIADESAKDLAAQYAQVILYALDEVKTTLEENKEKVEDAGEEVGKAATKGTEEGLGTSDNSTTSKIGEAATKAIKSVGNAFKVTSKEASNTITLAGEFAKAVYKQMSTTYLNTKHGKTLGNYILTGLYTAFTTEEFTQPTLDAAELLAHRIYETFAETLEIHSPSRIFMEMGKYICLGLAEGITKNGDTSVNDVEEMANNMVAVAYAALNNVLDDESLTPVITPVLDTTNIQNGVDWINGAFGNTRVGLVANEFGESNINDITEIVAGAVDRALGKYTKTIEDALRNNATDVNVDISLEGDADGLFKAIRSKNEVYRKMTGRSALA